MEEKEDEIIINVDMKPSINTYVRYKQLHMDKDYNPKCLVIKDDAKIIRIRILYTDIKFK